MLEMKMSIKRTRQQAFDMWESTNEPLWTVDVAINNQIGLLWDYWDKLIFEVIFVHFLDDSYFHCF